MGGDSSATIIWACLSFLRTKTISQGFDSTKTVSGTYDTVYIKDTNSVAVSSGFGGNACIDIIDIERKKVMTTISMDTYILGMAVQRYHMEPVEHRYL
jgi:hypothetical protein